MATVLSNNGELVNLTLDGRSVEKLTTVAVCEAGDISISITCQHLKTVCCIYDVEVKATDPPATEHYN